MTIDKKNNQRLISSIQLALFIIGVITLCIPIFSMSYLVTLDGPNHLYVSDVFYKVLAGNEFQETYFKVNEHFTPNYFTVLLLGGLQQLFSPEAALKVFHLLHILLLISGAFFWSNVSQKKTKVYPFLVFPFVYSYLFFSGFYNFIFAVSIAFWTLGIYRRFGAIWNIKRYLAIGGLLFLTYCSHIIPFFFAGLYIFLDTLLTLRQSKWDKQKLKHGVLLLASSAPGLLLTLLFMGGRESEYGYLEVNELISRLTSGFSIVLKPENNEQVNLINWSKLLFLATALMFFLYHAFTKRTKNNWVLLGTVFSTLLLYFVLPDSAGFASVFSVRIEYILWLFIVLGATQKLENVYLSFAPAVVGLGLLFFQINTNLPYWQMLNGHAKSIQHASEHIEDQSVVYPVFNSLIWDDYHISNFLSNPDKDILILENTSARQDYFPIIYHQPYEDCLKEQHSSTIQCNGQVVELDYLLIVGKYILEDPLGIELYAKAYNEGEVVYEDDFVQLLKFP